MEKTLHPISPQHQRTLIVDVLRGWALLGVVTMNYYDFFAIGLNGGDVKPDLLTRILLEITVVFFAGKSWTMLSLLFGYGFAVLMNNVKEKGHNAYAFFAGRMFWLLVLAMINSALFFGDILKDYAIMGLLLLPFYRANAKTMLIIGIVLLLGIPVLAGYINALDANGWQNLHHYFALYKSSHIVDVLKFGFVGNYVGEIINPNYFFTVHYVMFTCFLGGFYLYKINFFNQLLAYQKQLKSTILISLVLAIVLTVFLKYSKQHQLHTNRYFDMYYWKVLSTMICIGSTICWLYVNEMFSKFFVHLAIMGKMTLTNYMTQNLIGLLVFSGFGLGMWMSQPLWFFISLAWCVYTMQIFLSKWWLKRYNYGPIEWIWRQLSYRKRLPLKKQLTNEQ